MSSDLPDLRLLQSFVVIAEEGSLSRAAQRLHIAQQSLSQQMRLLEARVGAPLLERSSRGVTLTPVGESLLRESVPVIGHAQRAMETVARSVHGDGVVLRVGFLASLANELMPPLIRLFAERQPGVRLETETLSIAEIVAAVHSRDLDAAISRPALVDELFEEPLGSERIVIALPDSHPLTSSRTLRLADLADEDWVMTPRASWPPWHRKYDADFSAAGYEPRIVQRGTTPQALLALVAAGVGITRLAASARSLRSGGVTFIELEGERARTVLLTLPGHAHPALEPLRDLAIQALAAMPSA